MTKKELRIIERALNWLPPDSKERLDMENLYAKLIKQKHIECVIGVTDKGHRNLGISKRTMIAVSGAVQSNLENVMLWSGLSDDYHLEFGSIVIDPRPE